jgi:hypothetical protein
MRASSLRRPRPPPRPELRCGAEALFARRRTLLAAGSGGELSKYNGIGTKGAWSVWVGDFDSGYTGTLNSWSLIVTPETFACGP